MYYPYFRGKQFELQAIRDSSQTLADAGFIPIIEPVRKSTTGLNALKRALTKLIENNGKAFLVVNPKHGELKNDTKVVLSFIEDEFPGNKLITPAILLHEKLDPTILKNLLSTVPDNPILIHDGYPQAREISNLDDININDTTHVFIEKRAKTLYQRNFTNGSKVLIYDGFNKMNNADYPKVESFSELHITYKDKDRNPTLNGFGDFLIVGDNYSDSGGPAYAVAIHLTYIDPTQDDAMLIRHFISDKNDSPADPARKFQEALRKLIDEIDKPDSPFFMEGTAVREFRRLNNEGHFPGLGYVKKLSMIHHIETIADFTRQKSSTIE